MSNFILVVRLVMSVLGCHGADENLTDTVADLTVALAADACPEDLSQVRLHFCNSWAGAQPGWAVVYLSHALPTSYGPPPCPIRRSLPASVQADVLFIIYTALCVLERTIHDPRWRERLATVVIASGDPPLNDLERALDLDLAGMPVDDSRAWRLAAAQAYELARFHGPVATVAARNKICINADGINQTTLAALGAARVLLRARG